MSSLQQLAFITIKQCADDANPENNSITIDIERLATFDPLERDNSFGVCPVPLYNFKPEEVDLLNGDPNPDDVREVLSHEGILQYFFPPADTLALGLIERGANSPSLVEGQLLQAPTMGHPFGSSELVCVGNTNLTTLIDELQDRKLVIEGELGLEVGPEGQRVRRTIKFQPREGLVSKIINRFSFNFDLKGLLGK